MPLPSHLQQKMRVIQQSKSVKVTRARKMLAATFQSHLSYHEQPLEYDVALRHVNFDWSNLVTVMQQHDLVEPVILSDSIFMAKQEAQHDAESLFQVIQEDMIWRLHNLDSYKSPRPEVAKQFGVHEDQRYSPVFELQGRSGKHLVPTRFEDQEVRRYTEHALLDWTLPDDEFDLDWCRGLACMAEEWRLCFSSNAVHEELHYLAAAGIAVDINEAYEPIRRGQQAAKEMQLAHSLPSNPRFNW